MQLNSLLTPAVPKPPPLPESEEVITRSAWAAADKPNPATSAKGQSAARHKGFEWVDMELPPGGAPRCLQGPVGWCVGGKMLGALRQFTIPCSVGEVATSRRLRPLFATASAATSATAPVTRPCPIL